MDPGMETQAIVKVSWEQNADGDWQAQLRVVDDHGFARRSLRPGKPLAFEVGDDRMCTGHATGPGAYRPCPDTQHIASGAQCETCRAKDYYSDYVAGNTGLETDEDFSVYLAQCGEQVKVGVTKTARLEKRWVEQGADYATELYGALNADQALKIEDRISQDGIPERIRKEAKACVPGRVIDDVMEEHGFASEVVDVQEKTVYPQFSCQHVTRTGRFAGDVQTVKGQIVSNGRIALILSSGKTLRSPLQKGIDEF